MQQRYKPSETEIQNKTKFKKKRETRPLCTNCKTSFEDNHKTVKKKKKTDKSHKQ